MYALGAQTSWHSLDGGALFSITSAGYDIDPSLAFNVTATNNTNVTKTYTFEFNTPIDPTLTGSINSHADLTGVLTDLNGTHGTTTVKPFLGSTTMLNSVDYNTNGDAISKNVDIGTAISFTTLNGTQTTSFSKDGSLVCDVACDTMSAVLTFTLTKGSSVTFSGNVTQSPVPVPPALAMLVSGLGFMGLFGKRNKKAA